MASTLIQTRVDESLKQDATEVFESLGLDLSTAIRIFLTRAVQVKGIPFSMRMAEQEYKASAAVEAMKKMSEIAKANGISEMSLDEINAEIAAARQSRQ